jgi:hypothetical protein
LHRSRFDTTLDSQFSLTQGEIELATRRGNIAISLSKMQYQIAKNYHTINMVIDLANLL